MQPHICLCMLVRGCTYECGSSGYQFFHINNKGHSLSELVHVIVPISVWEFVVTVIVTMVETTDL